MQVLLKNNSDVDFHINIGDKIKQTIGYNISNQMFKMWINLHPLVEEMDVSVVLASILKQTTRLHENKYRACENILMTDGITPYNI